MRPSPEMSELELIVNVLKYKKGAIMIALFDSENAYKDDGEAARRLKLDVGALRLTATIDKLTPGRYAVKAFHDTDGSGKLEFALFGIPTKPVAFSNRAKILFGPPSWSKASFMVVPGKNASTIEID